MGKRGYGRNSISVPAKYIYLFLSILCVVMMLISFTTDYVSGPLETAAGYVIVPFQKGIASAGAWLSSRSENIRDINELNEENKRLREQISEMTIRINDLQRDKYELAELRSLFLLDEQYSDYEKVGARVIGKDTGNWYSNFVIDKGANDGIAVDMNVCAGSGLVGIVTKVGPNWANVRSIIDDTSNLSGMVMSTSDTLIVSGDLQLMEEGYISFSHLIDEDDSVISGDQVVTSAISNKYLPGLSVGYITEVDLDANNLTKSGYITPEVDFKNLSTVLVITELKEIDK
ncbi:MAG: rod shape-determining protein MreC [Lachnospiraceae bacterium]|nr:rod shape-determining protein MreC [Lachnospiraceae bacterium]